MNLSPVQTPLLSRQPPASPYPSLSNWGDPVGSPRGSESGPHSGTTASPHAPPYPYDMPTHIHEPAEYGRSYQGHIDLPQPQTPPPPSTQTTRGFSGEYGPVEPDHPDPYRGDSSVHEADLESGNAHRVTFAEGETPLSPDIKGRAQRQDALRERAKSITEFLSSRKQALSVKQDEAPYHSPPETPPPAHPAHSFHSQANPHPDPLPPPAPSIRHYVDDTPTPSLPPSQDSSPEFIAPRTAQPAAPPAFPPSRQDSNAVYPSAGSAFRPPLGSTPPSNDSTAPPAVEYEPAAPTSAQQFDPSRARRPTVVGGACEPVTQAPMNLPAPNPERIELDLKIAELGDKLRESEAQRRDLATTIEFVGRRSDAECLRAKTAEERATRLEGELATAKVELERERTESSRRLAAEVENRNSEESTLRREGAALQSEVAHLRRELLTLRDENAMMKHKLETWKNNEEEALAPIQERNKELEDELSALRNEHNERKAEWEESSKRLRVLEQVSAVSQREADQRAEEIRELKDRAECFHMEVLELTATVHQNQVKAQLYEEEGLKLESELMKRTTELNRRKDQSIIIGSLQNKIQRFEQMFEEEQRIQNEGGLDFRLQPEQPVRYRLPTPPPLPTSPPQADEEESDPLSAPVSPISPLRAPPPRAPPPMANVGVQTLAARPETPPRTSAGQRRHSSPSPPPPRSPPRMTSVATETENGATFQLPVGYRPADKPEDPTLPSERQHQPPHPHSDYATHQQPPHAAAVYPPERTSVSPPAAAVASGQGRVHFDQHRKQLWENGNQQLYGSDGFIPTTPPRSHSRDPKEREREAMRQVYKNPSPITTPPRQLSPYRSSWPGPAHDYRGHPSGPRPHYHRREPSRLRSNPNAVKARNRLWEKMPSPDSPLASLGYEDDYPPPHSNRGYRNGSPYTRDTCVNGGHPRREPSPRHYGPGHAKSRRRAAEAEEVFQATGDDLLHRWLPLFPPPP